MAICVFLFNTDTDRYAQTLNKQVKHMLTAML